MKKLYVVFLSVFLAQFTCAMEYNSLPLKTISEKLNTNFSDLKQAALEVSTLPDFRQKISNIQNNRQKISNIQNKKACKDLNEQLSAEFYAAIRGLKELSFIEAWFKVKGGFNANTTKKQDRKLRQIYLLPHVLSGHLFSPHYGESASIVKLKSLAVSRYFQEDDLGWRTNDSTRTDPSFICFFIDKMANAFNVILLNDTLLEEVTVTQKKGSFNIEIPSSVINNTDSPLNIPELLLQTYIGKLRLNEYIPIKDENVNKKLPGLKIQNLPLKSITVMVDENSLKYVKAFYIPRRDDDTLFKMDLEYLSNEFSMTPLFFKKVFLFLTDEISGKISDEVFGDVFKEKTLSAQLATTTLWPEFASYNGYDDSSSSLFSSSSFPIVLSVEAQQVIAYISKINSYTEKEVIILQLKEIAMGKGEEKKEKEPSEKQEQISKETATTFVQWFVQKKCFSLLQHPAFAEAFGYLWGSFNVTELKEEKSVLEKNINKQLTLMRSSSEALVQLARKIGIEVVPDFFLSHLPFSQSPDSSPFSGETLKLRLLEGEELNGLSPGLTNINNSCYFNATMQALFATGYFRGLKTLEVAGDDNMQSALVNLFTAMMNGASSSSYLDSKQHFIRVKNALSSKRLTEGQFLMNNDSDEEGKQEDSSELLEKILGVIDEEEAKKYDPSGNKKNIATWLATKESECQAQTKGNSMIENCGIKITRTTEFTEGHKHQEDCSNSKESSIVEYHPILQRSLDEVKLIKLDDLVKSEVPTKVGPYTCEQCNKNDIEVTTTKTVTSWPKTLIIKLDRFQVSENTIAGTKIQSPVQYTTKMTKGKQYHLTAVINHKGSSLDSGHYTAIVREKGKWYEKDDNKTFLFANSDDELEQNIRKKDKDAEYGVTYTQEAYVLIYENDEVKPSSPPVSLPASF